MILTVEAVIDERGVIRFIEPIELPPGRKVLVTILDELATPRLNETALLSEAALSDWNRPEEDEAWAEFQ
jgi:predicted DNA-binding antitoxin AbrB/MazE fold protein